MTTFERLDGTTQPTFHIGGPVGPGVAVSDDGQNAVEHQTPDGSALAIARAADPAGDSDLVTLRVLTQALAAAGLPPPKTPLSRWYVDSSQYGGTQKGLYG